MKLIIFACLLLIFVAGCSPNVISPSDISTPDTSPPVETSEPEPEPVFVEVPLSYEIVGKCSLTETLIHSGSIEIGDEGKVEATWEETIFIACVCVKNTDSISGIFTVVFDIENPCLPTLTTVILFIAPGETLSAECPAYTSENWWCQIIPSTKLVEQ